MSRLVTDDALRERLLPAGRERAREFTWENCARKTLAALDGVLSRP